MVMRMRSKGKSEEPSATADTECSLEAKERQTSANMNEKRKRRSVGRQLSTGAEHAESAQMERSSPNGEEKRRLGEARGSVAGFPTLSSSGVWGQRSLCWGTVLSIAGCSAASRASTH